MDISAWLRSLGLERYGQAFRENAIEEIQSAGLTARAISPRGPSVARMCETLVRLSVDQPQTCTGRKRQP
jgi:SAM domain (Sterile alpha motif)